MSKDQDRRKSRSNWASEALRLQLIHISRRFDIERVVLADRGGAIWAASDDVHVDSVALARLLPRLDTDGETVETHIASRLGVRMCELPVGETKLLLAAKGHDAVDALAACYRGVTRILGSLQAAA